MSSIFDPLGFLAALLLPAKLIIEDVCRSSVDWDEPLDLATQKRWNEWSKSLVTLETLNVKRCIAPERSN